MKEQVYGGAFDGLEVETWNAPEWVVLPCGARFFRRLDGKLYLEGCKWDDDTRGKVKS